MLLMPLLGDEAGLMARVAVLEAKVNLLSLALKGVVALIATIAVAYFFGR